VLICFLIANKTFAQPGSLDVNFGINGLDTLSLGADATMKAMAVQGDGKIVQAGDYSIGQTKDILLLRYTVNGHPDSSFGINGIVVTDLNSTNDYANAISVQTDGKIIVAGYTVKNNLESFLLVRYQVNGTIDSSFGVNGKVITSAVPGDSRVNTMAIQKDGRIVVAGFCYNGQFNDIALARYLTSGAIDPTFGVQGLVITPVGTGNSQANALALQSNGRIVVSGLSYVVTQWGPSPQFAVLRYKINGSPDSSFGASGIVNTAIDVDLPGFRDEALCVTVQSDGKIVAGGYHFRTSRFWEVAVVRYSINGDLDSTFSQDGKVTTHVGIFANRAHAISIQNDQKIVVGGYTKDETSLSGWHTILLRYDPNGALDTGFNGNGMVLSSLSVHDVTYGMQLANGRIYVSGYMRAKTSDYNKAFLAAYQNDGSPQAVPVPIITSFTQAGQPGSSITITGINFSSVPEDNIVYFGAVQAHVNSATQTSLSVTVPSGATWEPITVTDIATGLTGYSSGRFSTLFTNPFNTGIPANYFQPKFDLSTFSAISICDIDDDGKPDIIASVAGSSLISVFKNLTLPGSPAFTEASFAPPVTFQIEGLTRSISSGDIDGDGKQDIVVTTSTSVAKKLLIFRNTSGHGTIDASSLATPVAYPLTGSNSAIAVGDLDSDGKPDIITAAYSSLSVFHNSCVPGTLTSGSLEPALEFHVAQSHPSASVSSIAITDIDGDNKPELVLTTDSVYVFRNTTTWGHIDQGSMEQPINFGASFVSLVVGDVDLDGKPDIITISDPSSSVLSKVSVRRNTATAGSINASSFAPAVHFQSGFNASQIAIADIDGDGKPDIVTSALGVEVQSVLRNNSEPGVISPTSFAANIDFAAKGPLALGDLDADGIPEIVSNGILKIRDAMQTISFGGKVFLQGAYNASTGIMNNTLNAVGILADSAVLQPFRSRGLLSGNLSPAAESTYYTGTEKVSPTFFNSNSKIIDWLMVEVRDSLTPSKILATRAAFVQEDGTLLDIDGSDHIVFQGLSQGHYYIAIKHRNHLGIRSAVAIDLTNSIGNYDFTSAASQCFQNRDYTSTVQTGTVWAMRAGNANGDSEVKDNGPGNDQDRIQNQKLGGSLSAVASRQYAPEDINMDGIVKCNGPKNDQNLLLNIFLHGFLSAIFVQQL